MPDHDERPVDLAFARGVAETQIERTKHDRTGPGRELYRMAHAIYELRREYCEWEVEQMREAAR